MTLLHYNYYRAIFLQLYYLLTLVENKWREDCGGNIRCFILCTLVASDRVLSRLGRNVILSHFHYWSEGDSF